ncbi:MAG: Nif3-like dinuclear metal center hexameric protein [Clostridiales bacterium]|nr:Nif3-like dinuclear metal center hexameric protein [Clostridiales bacterium]
MKLSEFYKEIDAIAPKALSDEYCEKYGAYDNSGILVNTGAEVKKALFSLDLSLSAVDEAIKTGADLIVTHHPAIYGKISEIQINAFQPLGEKLIKCIQNGISVIAMHLNLDGAKGGIDESLQEGISKACLGEKKRATIMHPLTEGGYGRAYEVSEIAFDDFVKNVEREFSTRKTLVYQNGVKKVRKVASFCGAGADESSVAFAVEQGAQVIVSSDFKHHVVALALEKGLAVIALTHYASENYGFEKFYKKIRQKVEATCVYHTDAMLI